MASLTAFAAGAAIAGVATLFNQSDEANALDVPVVAGYNGTNNKARQNDGDLTTTATALSGQASNGAPAPSSPTSTSPTTAAALHADQQTRASARQTGCGPGRASGRADQPGPHGLR
jgi:hypothetical protein